MPKPPVCKIMDYGKHVFDIKKKVALQKKKQKQTQVKEMKFRPGTDEGDYDIKLRNLIRFLENGDKAKITLRFRGREMAHQQLGMDMMKRIEADLAELAQVEQFPKIGRTSNDYDAGPTQQEEVISATRVQPHFLAGCPGVSS